MSPLLLSLIPRRLREAIARAEHCAQLRRERDINMALRHDLHCATAHNARQAATIAHQAETIDQLSLSVLGLHGQLISTMIRAGEALTEAELAHPLPQHLPWNSPDHETVDYLRSAK